MTQSTSSNAPTIRGAAVTEEDGGRLNAFATEPRMEVVEAENGWGFHDRAEKLNGRMAMLGFTGRFASRILSSLISFFSWERERAGNSCDRYRSMRGAGDVTCK